MSLWAMSGAPLLVGADLTKLSDSTLATVTNAGVLAVDQDALGLQAVKVSETADGLQIWSKALSTPGERAVLLLNRTGEAASMTVNWGELGLAESSPASVKDVWAGKDLGAFNSSYSTTVPARDAVLVIVHGSEGKMNTYSAADGEKQSSGGVDVLPGRPVRFMQIARKLKLPVFKLPTPTRTKSPRFAELRVNGRIATRVAFPSTRSASMVGTIWIEALAGPGGGDE